MSDATTSPAPAERLSGGQYRPAWWWIIFGQLLALVALGWALTATVGRRQVEAEALRKLEGRLPPESQRVLRNPEDEPDPELPSNLRRKYIGPWYCVRVNSLPLPFVVTVSWAYSMGLRDDPVMLEQDLHYMGKEHWLWFFGVKPKLLFSDKGVSH